MIILFEDLNNRSVAPDGPVGPVAPDGPVGPVSQMSIKHFITWQRQSLLHSELFSTKLLSTLMLLSMLLYDVL